MGISGLLPALKSIIEPQHVRKYAGQKVAVDTVLRSPAPAHRVRLPSELTAHSSFRAWLRGVCARARA
jgi:hypothetical protein